MLRNRGSHYSGPNAGFWERRAISRALCLEELAWGQQLEEADLEAESHSGAWAWGGFQAVDGCPLLLRVQRRAGSSEPGPLLHRVTPDPSPCLLRLGHSLGPRLACHLPPCRGERRCGPEAEHIPLARVSHVAICHWSALCPTDTREGQIGP